MKLMKKLMKRNNKGMSLVELICAVAILGLTTTALGGAMVMSAQHYHRDSAEFEVQQEAQTATNLIGNLVVDAATAEWDGSVLTITTDTDTYKIYQKNDQLVYKAGSEEGVLAEGLPANSFKADTTKFKDNKTVNVSIKVENDGKEFVSNYNATSRNGELSSAKFADKVCVISMESELIIEPNQEYAIPVNVLGMSMEEVGGLVLKLDGVDNAWKTGGAYIKYEDNKIKIKAPANANSGITFKIETVNKKPNSEEKYAWKDVSVNVRRANGIIINKSSGDGYTAGSKYVFGAVVDAKNPIKGFGKGYDVDYVDPRYVDFEITGVAHKVVKDQSKTAEPVIEIELLENMAPGQKFYVKAIAAHAKGTIDGVKYNKTGDWYADLDATYPVECPNIPTPTIDPDYPIPTDFPSGLLRGEDYTWPTTQDDETKLKSKLQKKYAADDPSVAIEFEWYVSFRDKDTPGAKWTPYHMTVQNGSDQKIDGDYETTIMLPDKAYEIRFFVLYYDKNTREVVYPHDESLLAPGNGLHEAGFSKGWADEDAAATSFAQYGRSTELPAANLYYYTSNPNAPLDSVGTAENPIIKYKFGDSNTPKVNFDMRHLSTARTMYTYTPVVWKLQSDNSWKKLNENELKDIMKCEINNGTPRYVEMKEMQNIANTPEKKNAACGTYRIGIELGGTAKDYGSDAADSTKSKNFKDVSLETMELYDEANSKGFIYFKIEK